MVYTECPSNLQSQKSEVYIWRTGSILSIHEKAVRGHQDSASAPSRRLAKGTGNGVRGRFWAYSTEGNKAGGSIPTSDFRDEVSDVKVVSELGKAPYIVVTGHGDRNIDIVTSLRAPSATICGGRDDS